RVQVGGAGDAPDVAVRGELAGDGDRVGGVAAAVEVEDRVEDDLVGGTVEVGRAEDLDDLRDGVLREQHAAEDPLLGGDVVRWSALELRVVRSADLGNAHRRTPFVSVAGGPVRLIADHPSQVYPERPTFSRGRAAAGKASCGQRCGLPVQTRGTGCARPVDNFVDSSWTAC